MPQKDVQPGGDTDGVREIVLLFQSAASLAVGARAVPDVPFVEGNTDWMRQVLLIACPLDQAFADADRAVRLVHHQDIPPVVAAPGVQVDAVIPNVACQSVDDDAVPVGPA